MGISRLTSDTQSSALDRWRDYQNWMQQVDAKLPPTPEKPVKAKGVDSFPHDSKDQLNAGSPEEMFNGDKIMIDRGFKTPHASSSIGDASGSRAKVGDLNGHPLYSEIPKDIVVPIVMQIDSIEQIRKPSETKKEEGEIQQKKNGLAHVFVAAVKRVTKDLFAHGHYLMRQAYEKTIAPIGRAIVTVAKVAGGIASWCVDTLTVTGKTVHGFWGALKSLFGNL